MTSRNGKDIFGNGRDVCSSALSNLASFYPTFVPQERTSVCKQARDYRNRLKKMKKTDFTARDRNTRKRGSGSASGTQAKFESRHGGPPRSTESDRWAQGSTEGTENYRWLLVSGESQSWVTNAMWSWRGVNKKVFELLTRSKRGETRPLFSLSFTRLSSVGTFVLCR